MTLTEALEKYDWIPDPRNDHTARIAGPDNGAAIVVEENGNGLRCWLWCSKSDTRIGETVLHVDTPDELENVIADLFRLRQLVGDCPRCQMPMGIIGGHAECICGYVIDEKDIRARGMRLPLEQSLDKM